MGETPLLSLDMGSVKKDVRLGLIDQHLDVAERRSPLGDEVVAGNGLDIRRPERPREQMTEKALARSLRSGN